MRTFLLSTWWMMLIVVIACLAVIYAWDSFSAGSMDQIESLMLAVPAMLVALVCVRGIIRIYSIYHGKRSNEIETMTNEILRKAKLPQGTPPQEAPPGPPKKGDGR